MDRPSDFWWLPEPVDWKGLVVELGHHAPLHEWDERTLTPWIWKRGTAEDVIESWRSEHANVNVYRKLIVESPDGERFFGPVLLDIDCEEEITDDTGEVVGFENDLDIARAVACNVLRQLETSGLSNKDVRVFFSGRKGFHFEVRPSALGVAGDLQEQIDAAGEWERNLVTPLSFPQHSGIDKVFTRPFPRRPSYEVKSYHSCVRLHNSLNCWFDSEGRQNCRAKCYLSFQDVLSLPTEEICSRAEAASGDVP